MKKKLLSLVLALVMCLGLAAPAMAAEAQSSGFKQTVLSLLKNNFIFEGGIVKVEWKREEANVIKDGMVSMETVTVWEPTVYIPLGSKITLAPLAVDEGYKMVVFKDLNSQAIADETISYQFDTACNIKIGMYTKIEDYGIPLTYHMDIVVVNEPAAILKTPFLDIGNFDEPYEKALKSGKSFFVIFSQTLHEDVEWVYERGISNGTSATTFSPFSYVSRGQLIQMLWNYSGKPEPKSAAFPFEDVKETDGYYKALCWAYETGLFSEAFPGGANILEQFPDGNFAPDWNCSTSQVIRALNCLFNCELPDAIYTDEMPRYWTSDLCMRINMAHYLHYAYQYSTGTRNG